MGPLRFLGKGFNTAGNLLDIADVLSETALINAEIGRENVWSDALSNGTSLEVINRVRASHGLDPIPASNPDPAPAPKQKKS